MKVIKTSISFFLFVLALSVIPSSLLFLGYRNLFVDHFWVIFSFLCGITYLVVISVCISQQINSELGARMFLATTTFKILACLFFVLIYLIKNRVNKYVFVSDFFYVYFLSTIFEIYSLLCNLRNQNLG